jgi:murein DD-endopeptidase MepM/ murein hydrolase activator NlpD
VASVHEYKRFENNLVLRVKQGFGRVVGGLGSFFNSLGRLITRRYTIVLVPHSEKKVYNFHVSVFSICCFFLILAGMLGAFFWYALSWNHTRDSLQAKDNWARDIQGNLDQLQGELTYLLQEVRRFAPALDATLSVLGAEVNDNGGGAAPGDLASFFGIRQTPEGSLPEVEHIRRITEYLAAAAEPIRGIGTLLNAQSALLTEIPSIWPIKGGIGHISMFFGQNVNPFTGQYYIHKGIDLSTDRQGDPLVATADGQVVAVDFDQGGFGNNIIIRHKHGFYTRYGHMLSFRVKAGQRVQQGEVIGYIGNTGLSTGPHVHYEVHIGSDVVDPRKYLNIRSSIAKPGGR